MQDRRRRKQQPSAENSTEISTINGTEIVPDVASSYPPKNLANSTEKRAKAGALLSIGYNCSEVAKMVGVNESTVTKWLKNGDLTIDSKALQAIIDAIRAECVINAGVLVNSALRALVKQIDSGEITGKELSVTMGITFDKLTALLNVASPKFGTQNATQVNINFESILDSDRC